MTFSNVYRAHGGFGKDKDFGMRWFTSDLHFFHNLILKKYRSESPSLQEMHEKMIIQWNKQVKSRDMVYIIGDVSFGRWEETKEVLSKLNGRKVLIRGNHDDRFDSAQWVSLGFEDVRDVLVIKKETEKWMLCHYPYSSPFRFFFYYLKDRFFTKRGSANYYKLYYSYKGCKLLHGHHHTGPVYNHDQVNVAWDIHRKLLNENDIKDIFDANKPSAFKKILLTLKSLFI